FRPSDDATVFPFLIPSNFFAVVSLRQAAEMVNTLFGDANLVQELVLLADEVEKAIRDHAIVKHPKYGNIYAYEVDGCGGTSLPADVSIPSLLSLPDLDAVSADDPIYINT